MEETLSRRQFMACAGTLGYALATLPISAWAVSTDAKGIVVQWNQIPVLSDGKKVSFPAYSCRPEGKGPFPSIIVIHEIFGVHAYIQDVCRRLAHEGFFAIAPNLYHRYGDATQVKEIKDLMSQIVGQVKESELFADLDAVVQFIEDSRFGGIARGIGVTGFCWGGGATWKYCSANPKIKAGAAWYGPVASAPTANMPRNPLDLAPELKVPVLGLYGGKDARILVKDVEKMQEKLRAGTSGSMIEIYQEADHGFHADYRPTYHQKSAEDAWKKALAWFRTHGLK